jgi:hypothetical protein
MRHVMPEHDSYPFEWGRTVRIKRTSPSEFPSAAVGDVVGFADADAYPELLERYGLSSETNICVVEWRNGSDDLIPGTFLEEVEIGRISRGLEYTFVEQLTGDFQTPRYGRLVSIGGDQQAATGAEKQPPVILVICETDRRAILLCRRDRNARYLGDTLHRSVVAANQRAAEEYGDSIVGWRCFAAELDRSFDVEEFATDRLEEREPRE